MVERLQAFKPAASARFHLLLAAMMWTIVGAALAFFGGRWALAGEIPHVSLLLTVAVVGGLLKARYVLGRTAQRVIERIRVRGDGRCIGGFLSLRSWALVVAMAVGGRLLRAGFLPRAIVGLLYVAVGTALLAAGLKLWRAWQQHQPGL